MTSSFGTRVAVIASIALVVACTAAPSASSAPASATAEKALGGGNLNVRITSDWNTIDPSGASIPTTQAQELVLGLYDRLVATSPKGDVIPYLAKSWKQPDASTVSFELRTDVTCQDGTALTATAVANSFARAFKSPGAATVFGPAAPTITADEAAHTILFKWAKPNADAFFGFATAYASVICPAGLTDPTKLDTTPAGSGPYKLTDAKHGASAVLTKNPSWSWGPGGLAAKDLPDTLTFNVTTADTTAANQLITKELDVASVVGPDVDRLAANQQLTRITSSAFKLSPLMMNAQPGRPAADPQVRRAIMTAIDPAEWNQAAYNGRGVTGPSIFLKDSLCFEPATAQYAPKPGVQAAKDILTAAGYAPGPDGKVAKGGKTITLNVIGSPAQFAKGTEYIADRLNSAGFNVKLDDIERNTWVTRLRAGDYDVTVFPGAGNNVPSANMLFVAGPKPPAGTNYSYANDPQADADLEAALTAGEADRCQAWSKLQIDLLKNFDILPLAAPTFDTFTQSNVRVTAIAAVFDTATIRRTR